MASVTEFEIHSLTQVIVVASSSLDLLKKEVDCLRTNREDIVKRMSENRRNHLETATCQRSYLSLNGLCFLSRDIEHLKDSILALSTCDTRDHSLAVYRDGARMCWCGLTFYLLLVGSDSSANILAIKHNTVSDFNVSKSKFLHSLFIISHENASSH
ncbi:hypothetical protein H6P81_010104 [Aristolochia fimbriata]|uniref:Uncharacterized protein n=1 Tax=Aristolochia fimbriata TaxID=158543 RepID=A0AAV7ENF2_ARIFI|nr:hypothetical protein H6P81_010104 [Aristolochia fimbriata]